MPNSWKFSYPAQETASDKVCRWDWCDTVGSVLLDFQADEGTQDETSTGSWKERSCFIESWLPNIESMAWFKGKYPVNPLFEWFLHMCTIRYRVFPFPVSLKPTQWFFKRTHRRNELKGHGHWVNTLALNTDYVIRSGPYSHEPAKFKDLAEKKVPTAGGFMGYLY